MTDKKQDFEVSDEVTEMTEATMLGALMHCVVEQCKVLPKAWQALSEREQADYLERVELQCRAAVKQAVFLICAQDRVVIPATVEKVVFKDGVQAVLEVHRGANGVHDLADAAGETVHILVVDTTALESDKGKPKPEKDQRAMDLDLDSTGSGEPEPEPEDGAGGGAAVALEDLDSLEKMPRAERDELVKRATDLVVEFQVASTTFLQQKLGVSLHVVGQLLAVLASNGIVSTPNNEGLRTVLVADGQVQAEPDAEPPKGRRSCGCDVQDDEVDGSLDGDASGLQDCPGFEARGDTKDCKHCVHDEGCHAVVEEIEVPEFEEVDALYATALDLVVEHQKASISFVQRSLRVGYNRAARLVEALEACGVVSPMDGNGKRVVLPALGGADG